MAINENINLNITVNDDAVIAALNKTEKQLVDVEKEAAKAGKSIDVAFDKGSKAAKDLNRDLNKVEQQLKQVEKSGSGSGNGVMKGLRGIKSEMRLFNTIPGLFGMVGSAIGKAQEAIAFYNETFVASTVITKAVKDATADAVSGFIKEQGTLNDLKGVVESETASKKDKLLAIDALKKQFPEYFKNLTLENSKTGELTSGYKNATAALLANAKLKMQISITEKLQNEAILKGLEAQEAIKARIAVEESIANRSLASKILVPTFGVFAEGAAQIAESLAVSAAKTAAAALDPKAIKAAVNATFEILEAGAENIKGITDVTSEGLKELGATSEKTAATLKNNLEGSISDLEEKLSKVNEQIRSQTVAGDVNAITPLVATANALELQLKAAYDELEKLRTPKEKAKTADEGGNDAQLTIDEVNKLREDSFNQEIARTEALLRKKQSAEMALLLQTAATEKEVTDLQEVQEIERQRLTLETEKARLEFTLQYGNERTQVEIDTTKASIAAVTSELEALGKKGTEAITPGKKSKSFFDLLGLNPDTEEGAAAINGIKKGVGMAIDELSNMFAQQEQIAAAEVALRENNISQLQSSLANELELHEQGFASNVQLKQKQLKEEEAARAKALASQKKAQVAQLIMDTITQAANLITASSEIFSSFAALPFGIGVPIAATVIAAMVGAFIASKAMAFKAVKMADGGKITSVSAGGRSDIGDGRGHRIEDTNIVVGGGEYVTNAATTAEHTDFLHKLNANEYKGIDLVAAVEGKGRRIRGMQKAVEMIVINQKTDFNTAMEKQTKELTKYLHRMITDPKISTFADGSYLEVQSDLKGNRTITHIKKR